MNILPSKGFLIVKNIKELEHASLILKVYGISTVFYINSIQFKREYNVYIYWQYNELRSIYSYHAPYYFKKKNYTYISFEQLLEY